MSLSKLTKSTIISGANPVAVAKIDDVVHRLEPVETMREIKIVNFKQWEPKIINLAEFLDQDYKVVGVTIDFPEDDDDFLDNANTHPSGVFCNAHIRTISQNKVKENYILALGSSPALTKTFYINHNDTWNVKLTKNANGLIFRCVPVLIENSITIS